MREKDEGNGMSRTLLREQSDENAMRVVRSLMGWHDLAMPDIAAVIDASVGTVERRLSRKAATRSSFVAWELYALADYFGVPVEAFRTGEVDLRASRLNPDAIGRSGWSAPFPQAA